MSLKTHKAVRHNRDDYFYRQRGDRSVTSSNIEEWRFPDWIKPGMLVELASVGACGKHQKINTKGDILETSQPLYTDTPILVLVTKLSDNRGFLNGVVGEELYRFSGQIRATRIQESL